MKENRGDNLTRRNTERVFWMALSLACIYSGVDLLLFISALLLSGLLQVYHPVPEGIVFVSSILQFPGWTFWVNGCQALGRDSTQAFCGDDGLLIPPAVTFIFVFVVAYISIWFYFKYKGLDKKK